MAEAEGQFDELRRRIDALDAEIVARLNERAGLVLQIGRGKARAGIPVYVPDRERAVLERIRGLNDGPLSDRTLTAIYHELMSGSFALERPPRIAFIGPRGSYSHLAATRRFGRSVEYEPLAHIRAIFDELDREHVDLGVVPVENSTGGGVVDTLDAFIRHNAKICAEINLAVHHHLLGNCPVEEVEKVYSKPEAFGQCQRWLMETGLWDQTIPVASTSKAAELAAAESKVAAIGSALAGELFGLPTLCDRIEDDPDNVTRFVVIARESAAATGRDKTAVVFSTADQPGALVRVLDLWRQAGINMTFIESRPSRQRNWDYCFFVELEGHLDSKPMADSLEQVRSYCAMLKVLGSFPRADEVLQ
ncbi:MAG: prephenate dehydratase [bacterium]|nr:prephenate dehydratase [bacterium]